MGGERKGRGRGRGCDRLLSAVMPWKGLYLCAFGKPSIAFLDCTL